MQQLSTSRILRIPNGRGNGHALPQMVAGDARPGAAGADGAYAGIYFQGECSHDLLCIETQVFINSGVDRVFRKFQVNVGSPLRT